MIPLKIERVPKTKTHHIFAFLEPKLLIVRSSYFIVCHLFCLPEATSLGKLLIFRNSPIFKTFASFETIKFMANVVCKYEFEFIPCRILI